MRTLEKLFLRPNFGISFARSKWPWGPDSPVFIEEIFELPGVKIDGEYIDGIVFEGEDRLCYRRSAIVDDCNSPLNDWVCYTNSRDEPQIIPIY